MYGTNKKTDGRRLVLSIGFLFCYGKNTALNGYSGNRFGLENKKVKSGGSISAKPHKNVFFT